MFLWNSRPDPDGSEITSSTWEFQSLFLWNSRPDLSSDTRASDHLFCFNPCFCGTRARTLRMMRQLPPISSFQSLFLWNSRPDSKNSGEGRYPLKFQSLFLWNSRPDVVRGIYTTSNRLVSILVFVELAPGQPYLATIKATVDRFNPCFCGTRARTVYMSALYNRG